MSKAGCRSLAAGVLAVALLAGAETPVEAQYPWEGYDWSARTLRTHSAPVIPAFEGWYQEPEGTYRLCFGYWSGNTEEEVDIPLGPDNFIEPSEFDGGQPTHFMPVPRTGYRKHYCVHSVQVPEDFGRGRVVWTLRVGGQEYSCARPVDVDGLYAGRTGFGIQGLGVEASSGRGGGRRLLRDR